MKLNIRVAPAAKEGDAPVPWQLAIGGHIGFSLTQTILDLEYFPMRVIYQSKRCTYRRQTANKKTWKGRKSNSVSS